MTTIRFLAAAALAAPLLAASPQAAAAPSYDACTGFIPSLPTTISTQGVWCLNQDLNSAVTSGAALTINANNVTIDCNGFKFGGLVAGPATTAYGIFSTRSNVSVRDCNIRGFAVGVFLPGDAGGHRIERNRLQSNTGVGIDISGAGSLVRDNLVANTGGSTAVPAFADAIGIRVSGAVDVIDNRIEHVVATDTESGIARGIQVSVADGSLIARNRIDDLQAGASDITNGIVVFAGSTLDIRDNVVISPTGGFDTGILCASSAQVIHGNLVEAADAEANCSDGGGNYSTLDE
jgi:hypothetical protein